MIERRQNRLLSQIAIDSYRLEEQALIGMWSQRGQEIVLIVDQADLENLHEFRGSEVA